MYLEQFRRSKLTRLICAVLVISMIQVDCSLAFPTSSPSKNYHENIQYLSYGGIKTPRSHDLFHAAIVSLAVSAAEMRERLNRRVTKDELSDFLPIQNATDGEAGAIWERALSKSLIDSADYEFIISEKGDRTQVFTMPFFDQEDAAAEVRLVRRDEVQFRWHEYQNTITGENVRVPVITHIITNQGDIAIAESEFRALPVEGEVNEKYIIQFYSYKRPSRLEKSEEKNIQKRKTAASGAESTVDKESFVSNEDRLGELVSEFSTKGIRVEYEAGLSDDRNIESLIGILQTFREAFEDPQVIHLKENWPTTINLKRTPVSKRYKQHDFSSAMSVRSFKRRSEDTLEDMGRWELGIDVSKISHLAQAKENFIQLISQKGEGQGESADGVVIGGFTPWSQNWIWQMNKHFWIHMKGYMAAQGRDYRSSVDGSPKGDADFAADRARALLEKLRNIRNGQKDTRALSAIEMGVASPDFTVNFLRSLESLAEESGEEDLLRNFTYVLADYARSTVKMVNEVLEEYAPKYVELGGTKVDAIDPLRTLEGYAGQVVQVHGIDVYDNLPYDNLAKVGDKFYRIESRIYLPKGEAEKLTQQYDAIRESIGLDQFVSDLRNVADEENGAQKFLEKYRRIFRQHHESEDVGREQFYLFWADLFGNPENPNSGLKVEEQYVEIDEGANNLDKVTRAAIDGLRGTEESLRMQLSNTAILGIVDIINHLLHQEGAIEIIDVMTEDLEAFTEPKQIYASNGTPLYRISQHDARKYDGSIVARFNVWLFGEIIRDRLGSETLKINSLESYGKPQLKQLIIKRQDITEPISDDSRSPQSLDSTKTSDVAASGAERSPINFDSQLQPGEIRINGRLVELPSNLGVEPLIDDVLAALGIWSPRVRALRVVRGDYRPQVIANSETGFFGRSKVDLHNAALEIDATQFTVEQESKTQNRHTVGLKQDGADGITIIDVPQSLRLMLFRYLGAWALNGLVNFTQIGRKSFQDSDLYSFYKNNTWKSVWTLFTKKRDPVGLISQVGQPIFTVGAQLRSKRRIAEMIHEALENGAEGILAVSGGGLYQRSFSWLPGTLSSEDVLREADRQKKESPEKYGHVRLLAVSNPNTDKDTPERLIRKVDLGAQTILTQPPLIWSKFEAFMDGVKREDIHKRADIRIGIPYFVKAYDVRRWMMLIGVNWRKDEEARALVREFERAEKDLPPEVFRAYSRKWSTDLIKKIRDAYPEVTGFHFMPQGNMKSLNSLLIDSRLIRSDEEVQEEIEALTAELQSMNVNIVHAPNLKEDKRYARRYRDALQALRDVVRNIPASQRTEFDSYFNWIIKAENFRRDIAIRREDTVSSGTELNPELAFDVHQLETMTQEDMRQAMREKLRELGDGKSESEDGIVIEKGNNFVPFSQSLVWKFNNAFWQHVNPYMSAKGQDYRESIGGSPDGNVELVRYSASQFLKQLEAAYKAEGDQMGPLYYVEVGVASTDHVELFIEELTKIAAETDKKYLLKYTGYLLADFSDEILKSAKEDLGNSRKGVKLEYLKVDAEDPFRTLGRKYKGRVLRYHATNVFDNLPTDKIAYKNGQYYHIHARLYIPNAAVDDIVARYGTMGVTHARLRQDLERLQSSGDVDLFLQEYQDLFRRWAEENPYSSHKGLEDGDFEYYGFWNLLWNALKAEEQYIAIEDTGKFDFINDKDNITENKLPKPGHVLDEMVPDDGSDIWFDLSNHGMRGIFLIYDLLHYTGVIEIVDIMINDWPADYRKFRGPFKYDGSIANYLNWPLIRAVMDRYYPHSSDEMKSLADFGDRKNMSILEIHRGVEPHLDYRQETYDAVHAAVGQTGINLGEALHTGLRAMLPDEESKIVSVDGSGYGDRNTFWTNQKWREVAYKGGQVHEAIDITLTVDANGRYKNIPHGTVVNTVLGDVPGEKAWVFDDIMRETVVNRLQDETGRPLSVIVDGEEYFITEVYMHVDTGEGEIGRLVGSRNPDSPVANHLHYAIALIRKEDFLSKQTTNPDDKATYMTDIALSELARGEGPQKIIYLDPKRFMSQEERENLFVQKLQVGRGIHSIFVVNSDKDERKKILGRTGARSPGIRIFGVKDDSALEQALVSEQKTRALILRGDLDNWRIEERNDSGITEVHEGSGIDNLEQLLENIEYRNRMGVEIDVSSHVSSGLEVEYTDSVDTSVLESDKWNQLKELLKILNGKSFSQFIHFKELDEIFNIEVLLNRSPDEITKLLNTNSFISSLMKAGYRKFWSNRSEPIEIVFTYNTDSADIVNIMRDIANIIIFTDESRTTYRSVHDQRVIRQTLSRARVQHQTLDDFPKFETLNQSASQEYKERLNQKLAAKGEIDFAHPSQDTELKAKFVLSEEIEYVGGRYSLLRYAIQFFGSNSVIMHRLAPDGTGPVDILNVYLDFAEEVNGERAVFLHISQPSNAPVGYGYRELRLGQKQKIERARREFLNALYEWLDEENLVLYVVSPEGVVKSRGHLDKRSYEEKEAEGPLTLERVKEYQAFNKKLQRDVRAMREIYDQYIIPFGEFDGAEWSPETVNLLHAYSDGKLYPNFRPIQWFRRDPNIATEVSSGLEIDMSYFEGEDIARRWMELSFSDQTENILEFILGPGKSLADVKRYGVGIARGRNTTQTVIYRHSFLTEDSREIVFYSQQYGYRLPQAMRGLFNEGLRIKAAKSKILYENDVGPKGEIFDTLDGPLFIQIEEKGNLLAEIGREEVTLDIIEAIGVALGRSEIPHGDLSDPDTLSLNARNIFIQINGDSVVARFIDPAEIPITSERDGTYTITMAQGLEKADFLDENASWLEYESLKSSLLRVYTHLDSSALADAFERGWEEGRLVSSGTEFSGLISLDDRERLSALWREWQPRRSFDEQSATFHDAHRQLQDNGYGRALVVLRQEADSDLFRRGSEVIGTSLNIHPGWFDQASHDSLMSILSNPVLQRIWPGTRILENVWQYADFGLIMEGPEGRWVILDQGPGIADLSKAITGGTSVDVAGSVGGNAGWGLTEAIGLSQGGVEIWTSNGTRRDGLYIPQGQVQDFNKEKGRGLSGKNYFEPEWIEIISSGTLIAFQERPISGSADNTLSSGTEFKRFPVGFDMADIPDITIWAPEDRRPVTGWSLFGRRKSKRQQIFETNQKLRATRDGESYFVKFAVNPQRTRLLYNEYHLLSLLQKSVLAKGFPRPIAYGAVTNNSLFENYHVHKGSEYLAIEFLVTTENLMYHFRKIGADNFALRLALLIREIHRLGYVHRDLKPQNLIVTEEGLKILDLESAIPEPLTMRDLDEARTLLVHTPEYSDATWQTDVDYRQDIYSFGLVMMKLWTDRLPKQLRNGETISSVLSANPELAKVIEKALAPTSERYQSIDQVIMDLRRLGAREVSSGAEFDLLPEGELRTLYGHTGQVTDVDFSPDGRLIASAGGRGELYLWDVKTGYFISRLQAGDGTEERLAQVAFSPDGKLIGAFSEHGITRVWDINTGELVSESEIRLRPSLEREPRSVLTKLYFSPDNKPVLLISDEKAIKVGDAEKPLLMQTVHRFTGNEAVQGRHQILAADLNAIGTHLITVGSINAGPTSADGISGSDIRLWDVRSRRLVRVFSDPGETISVVSVSPDNQHFATGGSDQSVRLWRTSSPNPIRIIAQHTDSIASIDFSPDGKRIVSSSSNGEILVSSLDGTSESISLSAGHNALLNKVAFDRSGSSLVSASSDQTLKLWGVATENISSEDAIRLVGLSGGLQSVEELLGLASNSSEENVANILTATLVASSHPDNPTPLNTTQWRTFAEALPILARSEETRDIRWLTFFERAFADAIQIEGEELDAIELTDTILSFLNTLRSETESFETIDAAAFGSLNPKDQIAYAVLALSLRGRFAQNPTLAWNIFIRMLRSAISYPELIQFYRLWHAYPNDIDTALSETVNYLATISTRIIARNWNAFLKWILHISQIFTAFERMGLANLIVAELNPDSWEQSWHYFENSTQFLNQSFTRLTQDILGIQFGANSMDPLSDTVHLSDLERHQLITALVYQAEHAGETLRSVLGSYVGTLAANPGDQSQAASVANSQAFSLVPETLRPTEPYIAGPGAMELVVAPVARERGLNKRLQTLWGSALSNLTELNEVALMQGDLGRDLRRLADRLSEAEIPRSSIQDVQEEVYSLTQTALEALSKGEREPVLPLIRKVRLSFQNVASLLKAHSQTTQSKIVQLNLQHNPVKRLLFSHPTRGCLDCATGIFKHFSQYYAVNPRLQIIVAEELAQPDQELPLARLTVYQASDGSIVAVNGLFSLREHDFYPVFVDYMERYAQVVQAPAILPTKFFQDSPGDKWEKVEIDIVLPEGADHAFHMDLTGGQALPENIKGLSAWRYTPAEEGVLPFEKELRSPARLNILLQMMDRFLRANNTREVHSAFTEGVENILGYTGAVLYYVNPETGNIKSGIRTLETDTRYADWAEPVGEHREALERFQAGSETLHIRDRFDQSEAPYVDRDRLETDRARHPNGDVKEVYYITLTDAKGTPWGLLMVNRWETGEPLFPGTEAHSERERQYQEVLGGTLRALGNGALLALDQMSSISELNAFMGFHERGGQIAGELNQILNMLRNLSDRTGSISGDHISDISDLSQQIVLIADSLERSARETMKIIRERRAQALEKRGAPSSLVPVVDLDSLEVMFGDLSINLLNAINDGNGEIDRVEEVYTSDPQFREGTTQRNILDDWIILARSAIEARQRIYRENQTLPERLDVLREQALTLNELKERIDSLLEREDLGDLRTQAVDVSGLLAETSEHILNFVESTQGDESEGEVSSGAENIPENIISHLKDADFYLESSVDLLAQILDLGETVAIHQLSEAKLETERIRNQVFRLINGREDYQNSTIEALIARIDSVIASVSPEAVIDRGERLSPETLDHDFQHLIGLAGDNGFLRLANDSLQKIIDDNVSSGTEADLPEISSLEVREYSSADEIVMVLGQPIVSPRKPSHVADHFRRKLHLNAGDLGKAQWTNDENREMRQKLWRERATIEGTLEKLLTQSSLVLQDELDIKIKEGFWKDRSVRIHGDQKNRYLVHTSDKWKPRNNFALDGGAAVAFQLKDGRVIFFIGSEVRPEYEARILNQIPEAKDLIFRIPEGWFVYSANNGKTREDVLLPSPHIDGVINAIPHQASRDGIPILLIDPVYAFQAQPREGKAPWQLLADQGLVKIVEVDLDERHLNPTNLVVLPDNQILLNQAPLTATALLEAGVKEEFLHQLPEPLIELSQFYTCLGCLVGIAPTSLVKDKSILKDEAKGDVSSGAERQVQVDRLDRQFFTQEGILDADNPGAEIFLKFIQDTVREDPEFFKDKVVLEIGTGSGVLAIALARAGATVIALDIAESAIELAYKNLEGETDEVRERITFGVSSVYGNLFRITEIEEFDYIISNNPTKRQDPSGNTADYILSAGESFEVISHILNGMDALLKPSGSTYIQTRGVPNTKNPERLNADYLREHLLSDGWDFEPAGFESVDTADSIPIIIQRFFRLPSGMKIASHKGLENYTIGREFFSWIDSDDSTLTFEAGRFGPTHSELYYRGSFLLQSIQVKVSDELKQKHNQLKKFDIEIPRIPEDKKDHPDFGTFGHVLIDLYQEPSGEYFVLIEEIQPSDEFRQVRRKFRNNINGWRRATIEKIAEWFNAKDVPVYMVTAEAIDELEVEPLSPYESQTSYKDPVDPLKWERVKKIIKPTMNSSAGELEYYVYRDNEKITATPPLIRAKGTYDKVALDRAKRETLSSGAEAESLEETKKYFGARWDQFVTFLNLSETEEIVAASFPDKVWQHRERRTHHHIIEILDHATGERRIEELYSKFYPDRTEEREREFEEEMRSTLMARKSEDHRITLLREDNEPSILLQTAVEGEGLSQVTRLMQINMPEIERRRLDKLNSPDLWRAVGREMGRIHALGMVHDDLYWHVGVDGEDTILMHPYHILLTQNDNLYEATFIDYGRARLAIEMPSILPADGELSYEEKEQYYQDRERTEFLLGFVRFFDVNSKERNEYYVAFHRGYQEGLSGDAIRDEGQDRVERISVSSGAEGAVIPQPSVDQLKSWFDGLNNQAPHMQELYGWLNDISQTERAQIFGLVSRAYRSFGQHMHHVDKMLPNNRGNLKIHEKPDGSYVTDIDIQTQNLFNDLVRRAFPNVQVIGEEGNVDAADTPWRVMRDPIDGTAAYILEKDQYSSDHYLSTLTLMYKEHPVLTIITGPEYEYLKGSQFEKQNPGIWLTAGLGINGALINGNLIGDASTRPLSEVVAATFHPENRMLKPTSGKLERYEAVVRRKAKETVDYVNNMGMFEMALSLLDPTYLGMMVTAGQSLWDVAPPWHISRALGIEVRSFNRQPLRITESMLQKGDEALTPDLIFAISQKAYGQFMKHYNSDPISSGAEVELLSRIDATALDQNREKLKGILESDRDQLLQLLDIPVDSIRNTQELLLNNEDVFHQFILSVNSTQSIYHSFVALMRIHDRMQEAILNNPEKLAHLIAKTTYYWLEAPDITLTNNTLLNDRDIDIEVRDDIALVISLNRRTPELYRKLLASEPDLNQLKNEYKERETTLNQVPQYSDSKVKTVVNRIQSTLKGALQRQKGRMILALDTSILNFGDIASRELALTDLLNSLGRMIESDSQLKGQIVLIHHRDPHILQAQVNQLIRDKKEEKISNVIAIMRDDHLKPFEVLAKKSDEVTFDLTSVISAIENESNLDNIQLNYIPILQLVDISLLKSLNNLSLDDLLLIASEMPNIGEISEKDGGLVITILPEIEAISPDEMRNRYQEEAEILIAA